MSRRCLAEPTRAIQCPMHVTAEMAVSLASRMKSFPPRSFAGVMPASTASGLAATPALRTICASKARPTQLPCEKSPACCSAPRTALQSIGSACESDCLLRCHRAHTAVTASSPHDTCEAELTARQQQPSAKKPARGCSAGSCSARRIGALRPLHG